MESSELLARDIRMAAVRMVAHAKASHLGGALSMADLLAVLWLKVLQVRPQEPKWAERDRFILSKGHCCASLYAVLAKTGFLPEAELETYGRPGSRLMAHANHRVPGVELSTGSLGHGLPFGVGKALAAKRLQRAWRVFVMLSDGELDEGSNWEAILFAPHHRLDNLVAVVDSNRIQSLGRVEDVMALEPLAEKFRAFNWAVREVDGHDHGQIADTLCAVPFEPGRPSCVVAHTVKGKGVSFMEGRLEWHYRSPDAAQLQQALLELADA